MSVPIYVRKAMLAATIEDETDLAKINFPVLVSRKYDGVRCVVDDDGVPRSRKGEPFGNQWMADVLKSVDLANADGEIGVGSPTDKDFFTRTSGFCRRAGDRQKFTFYIFDWQIPGIFEMRMTRKVPVLEGPIADWLTVEVVSQDMCQNVDDLRKKEWDFVGYGYEGIMIRGALASAQYKYGRATLRSQELLKWKRFEDTEGVIEGFEEAETNTNEKTRNALGDAKRSSAKAGKVPNGMAGKLLVKSPKFSEVVKIGTGEGLTHALRKDMWDNPKKYIGRTVTFTFQAGSDYVKPRFASFKGFRDDGI